ncbi:hypothetical protein CY34DRAFT_413911 [Suillus luteus UH-Slu-Lm8-n1]|uniref:Uncharacterized protein n=1 Tax=Suillus luteus UH-Slu-Lm8-n1 TaxID=930992 RepID=A0A0D0AUR5_9AGAM|nr:hypothetical protein CY34DRAFT_413911 [Suillus luteus UH-Slu-Lm8-n1]
MYLSHGKEHATSTGFRQPLELELPSRSVKARGRSVIWASDSISKPRRLRPPVTSPPVQTDPESYLLCH